MVWLPWRRIPVVDVAIALGILLVGMAELTRIIPGSVLPGSAAVSVVFIVATAVPLVFRRVLPMTTFLCVVVVTAVWQYSEYSIDQQQTFASFVALLLAVFGAGAYTRGRTAAAALATVGVAVVFAVVDLVAGAPPGMAIPPLIMIVGVFGLGRLVSGYQARTRQAIERVVRAEQEAEQMRLAAVAEERTRIARELHDVVSHDVSYIVVQASVERRLRQEGGGSGGVDVDVLAGIETAGRDALTELRRMLGVLRSSDDADGRGPAPLEPQPSLARLDELVEQSRAAGLDITVCREDDDTGALPSGLDLAAYRIVQESLTNVVKHVGPTKVTVALRSRAAELEIEVVDAGPARPSALPGGHGLIGMRERVALFGGTLETGRHGNGFRVLARLPLLQVS